MNYRASLIGYHNPHKHKDMSPKDFLDSYIESMKGKSLKKDGIQRVRLAEWVEENYEDQLKYVARLFSQTLKPNTEVKMSSDKST